MLNFSGVVILVPATDFNGTLNFPTPACDSRSSRPAMVIVDSPGGFGNSEVYLLLNSYREMHHGLSCRTPGHCFSNHHPNQRHFQVGTNTTLKNTSQGVLVLEGLASGSWSPWNTLGVKSSYSYYSWTQWQQNWNVCDSLIPLWMPGGWLRWHFIKP